MNQELIIITGHCLRKIYYSATSSYGVYVVKRHDVDQTVIINGNFEALVLEQAYSFQGQFIQHATYGQQFKVINVTLVKPDTQKEIIKFLSSKIFSGIGPKKALKIVEHYGIDLFEKIALADFVFDDDFLSDNQKQLLKDMAIKFEGYSRILELAQNYELDLALLFKIYGHYGEDAFDIVINKPYELILARIGIGYKTVYKIARSVGYNNLEVEAGAFLNYEVMELSLKTGSTCISYEQLSQYFSKFPYSEANFDDCLEYAINNNWLVKHFDDYYHPSQAIAEKNIAQFMKRLNSKPQFQFDELVMDETINQLEQQINFNYDYDQRQAIYNSLVSNISLITGGPGSGKTTLLFALVKCLLSMYPDLKIAVCAPTGKAVKRLKDILNINVTTIHSLLEWDNESNTFHKNQNNPLDIDILIIDEFSMVDNYLMGGVVSASFGLKKLIVVGDKDQLTPVAPGYLIRDFINSQLVLTTYLTYNHRQNSGSNIVSLANSILEAEFSPDYLTNDVSFIETNNISDVVINEVLKLKNQGIKDNDILVLACMYAGIDGINNLNNQLQLIWNSHSHIYTEYGQLKFHLGDKVLLCQNRIDDFVFNGDSGYVVEIVQNEEESYMEVDFDGNIVRIDREDYHQLKLGYCLSVHKAQGSECSHVIFVCSNRTSYMLNQHLVYTALTRAKDNLVIVGQLASLANSCYYDNTVYIKTHLLDF